VIKKYSLNIDFYYIMYMGLTCQLQEIRELSYKLFDVLVNERDDFLRLVQEREGVNTPIEFYYKVLIDAVSNDEKMLDYLPVLVKPIVSYFEGRPVDYGALTYIIIFLSKPSSTRDEYSLLFEKALFD
jgi:hypothetical protein